MRLQSTMSMWKIMVIGLVLILGGCGLPAAPRAPGAPDVPLLLAQTRWQARRPARYRLVVQEDTADRSCRQAVEVQDERVLAVLEDDCGRATPWTVSSLLDWIGDRARTSSACARSSIACVCQLHQTARAIFDPQLGYPYATTYQWTFAPNWTYLRPWQQIFGSRAMPNCAISSGMADGSITIRVVSLTTLP